MKSITKSWGKTCANKVGISEIDANDKIDLVTTKQQLDKVEEPSDVERMMRVFQACEEKMTSTEPCRLAYECAICYYNMDPEIFFYT
ncbi:hypothetical protein KQX54_019466 [Cotesia glomerata]|uniref:Uncharacterized protein n=1 Tax=Cotesia glomerata TaxID=32391 RepID=A0AAV7I1J2_COTGL|nr:hypothetical protein KQX54_019466 [Cotesia glomerata]